MRGGRTVLCVVAVLGGCSDQKPSSPHPEPIRFVEKVGETRFFPNTDWRWRAVPAELAANPPRVVFVDRAIDANSAAAVEFPVSAPYVWVAQCELESAAPVPQTALSLRVARNVPELDVSHRYRTLPIPRRGSDGTRSRFVLTFNTWPGETIARLQVRAEASLMVKKCEILLPQTEAELRELAGFRGFAENPVLYPWRKYLGLDGELKQSLIFAGGAAAAFPVRIPPNAVLETHVAVVASNSFRGKASFVVEFVPGKDGAPRPVIDTSLSAAPGEIGVWKKVSRSMEEFANQDGFLVFRATGAKGESPLLAWGTPTLFTRAKARAPNVLVITIDSLNRHRMTGAPGARDTTPFLSSLAKRGVAITQFHPHYAVTYPSLLSMIFSRDDVGPLLAQAPETKEAPHLMSALRRAGYLTEFRGDMETNGGLLGLVDSFRVGDTQPSDRALLEKALESLRDRGGAPLALWLHLDGPHVAGLLEPSHRQLFDDDAKFPSRFPDLSRAPVWRDKIELHVSERERVLLDYDRRLRLVDDLLAGFWKRATEEGLLESTLVVVTADHGEDLFAHNRFHRGHGVLYDTNLSVPLWWIEPQGAPARRTGRRIEAPMPGIDLAPTLLAYLGLPVPPEFAGRNFLSVMDGARTPRRFIVARAPCADGNVFAVRLGTHKMIHSPSGCQPAYPDGYQYQAGGELYDLLADPGEIRNLIDEQPERARFLRRQVADLDASSNSGSGGARSFSEKLHDVMRMAGYVQ